jgi:uncharacterized protein with NRDE domain
MSILTSNRDEQALRRAIEPRSYHLNGRNLVFPKDPQAGGTWFVVDELGTAAVLLNGAATRHQWNPPYSRSRGLILLDLVTQNSAVDAWELIDLEGVEPFTIVLFESGELYQLRWDGITRERTDLDTSESYIWSSAQLYSPEVRKRRQGWFEKFMHFSQQADPRDIYDFHQFTESGDTENGLVINRNNFLKTISITQAVIESDEVRMRYKDLTNQQEFSHRFAVN